MTVHQNGVVYRSGSGNWLRAMSQPAKAEDQLSTRQTWQHTYTQESAWQPTRKGAVVTMVDQISLSIPDIRRLKSGEEGLADILAFQATWPGKTLFIYSGNSPIIGGTYCFYTRDVVCSGHEHDYLRKDF